MPWNRLWKKSDMESEVKKYLDLRIDEMKLKVVDGLSVGVSRVLSLMVVVMLGAIVLATFAFGIVLLLGDLIGSWAAAAFIISGAFLIALVVILFVWKKLFTDIFVKLFIDIFYGNE